MAEPHLNPRSWDRPLVDFMGLKEGWSCALAAPLDVLSRVPLGIAWAQTIDLVLAPPSGYTPLQKGSRWSSSGSNLAVVTPPRSVEPQLRDFVVLSSWADAIRSHLPESLRAALVHQDRDPSYQLGLAAYLELDPQTLEQWGDAEFRQLGVWAERPWQPEIRIQQKLRPSIVRQEAHKLGVSLARKVRDPSSLIISDSPYPLELCSPYARDLASALEQWVVENEKDLACSDLARCFRQRQFDTADLCQVASAQLSFHADAEVMEERRQAEASQGLFVEDHFGLALGFAQPHRLDRPDPVLADVGEAGPIAIVYSERTDALQAAVEGFRSVWPSVDLSMLAKADSDGFLAPSALTTEGDGFALPAADHLRSAAESVGLSCPESSYRVVEERHWMARILGQVRRDTVLARCSSEVCLQVGFYPRGDKTKEALAALGASRAILVAAIPDWVSSPSGVEEEPAGRVSTAKNRPNVRRFRV